MDNKVCFMFGHATTPSDVLPLIEETAERQYVEQGIRTFIVGNRGSFDRYASTAIKALKRRYNDITLMLLLAYHPGERAVELSEGFDGSYYPLLENVPKRYAIVRANQYMIDTADSVICYVNHVGNTRKLLEYAQRRQRRSGMVVDNISDKCDE